jgi:hypothetical protein
MAGVLVAVACGLGPVLAEFLAGQVLPSLPLPPGSAPDLVHAVTTMTAGDLSKFLRSFAVQLRRA